MINQTNMPFVIIEPRGRQYLADVLVEPQLWVVPPYDSGVASAVSLVVPVFSVMYFARNVLSAVHATTMAADSYFWLGATSFARVAPYLRCLSAVVYLSSLSVVLRGCLGLEELGGAVIDRGFDGGAELVNIRYNQRVLMQSLRFTLFTLSGNVPHLLNNRRFIQLASQVGRGYLLQRCTFSTRMLLRCCKFVLRREEVAYLLHGGYVFVNGQVCLASSYQLTSNDCLQMVFSRAFLLYLWQGWISLYSEYARLLVVQGMGTRVRRGLSQHLYTFDDVPLGLEVDYVTLTVFCLPACVPPYEWSWALAYYLTWGDASVYLWRYVY